MRNSQRQTVLITGFGPFPGMPDNPSGPFATDLANEAQNIWPHIRFVSHVFDTKWSGTSDELKTLYCELAPSLALHFGVGNQKTAILIERWAKNQISGTEDATGKTENGRPISPTHPSKLRTMLPPHKLLQALQRAGFNAHISDDAGTYLCNYLFFTALSEAKAAQSQTSAGFFHLPTCLCQHIERKSYGSKNNHLQKLTFAQMLEAGLIILTEMLGPGKMAQPLQRIQRTSIPR